MGLTSCCCCFSLRTGVLIMGWLDAVFAGLLCVSLLTSIGVLDVVKNESKNPDERAVLGVLLVVAVFFTFMYAIKFIMSVLLLIGVYKKRASFLIPTMVASCMVLVLEWFRVLFVDEYKADGEKGVRIVACALVTALGVYFLMVIKSYYNELKEYAKSSNEGYVISGGFPPTKAYTPA